MCICDGWRCAWRIAVQPRRLFYISWSATWGDLTPFLQLHFVEFNVVTWSVLLSLLPANFVLFYWFGPCTFVFAVSPSLRIQKHSVSKTAVRTLKWNWNKTVSKLSQNCFETVLFQFHFGVRTLYLSLCHRMMSSLTSELVLSPRKKKTATFQHKLWRAVVHCGRSSPLNGCRAAWPIKNSLWPHFRKILSVRIIY